MSLKHWCAAAALAGVLTAAAGYAAKRRKAGDGGLPSLAAAAQVPPASAARTVSVVVLADNEGGPGTQRREETLAAAGVDASPASLRAVKRYLESRAYRTAFAREALEALRSGWALNWETGEYLDAAALGAGRKLPPDYMGFLETIRLAPVSSENYRRLEDLAGQAASAQLTRIDSTQKLYEGVSAAYAHFGQSVESSVWLDKIQGLWPLYSEEIRVEPVETDLDCGLSGELFLDGRPASRVKVGLFAVTSTTTVFGAQEGLVDSTYPDARGAFQFSRLAPGRYYLALQAPAASSSRLAAIGAPGAVRLLPESPYLVLPPIELRGG